MTTPLAYLSLAGLPIIGRVRSLGEPSGWASAEARRDLRRALLSIYLHVVGRHFRIRGPASVLLPPEVRPMSLSHALAVISPSPVRLREVLWRIVESVSVKFPVEHEGSADKYPIAIAKYFDGRDLADLDRLRRDYRRDAGAFIATLLAVRDNNFDLARDLIDWMDHGRSIGRRSAIRQTINFSAGLKEILGAADSEYLRKLLPPQAHRPTNRRKLDRALERLARQTARIESEMGVCIQQLVENLADVAAFEKFTLGLFEDTRKDRTLMVYPACTTIRQDARTMLTRVTTTSIVKGPFKTITDSIDPAHWARSSDIIQLSRYVRDPLSLKPVKLPSRFGEQPGNGDLAQRPPRFLEEDVRTSWSSSEDQRATYHNVLNIATTKRRNRKEADVTYNLCRSINSAVLWDAGPGGLLMDEGYIKLRPLACRDSWRLTMRKEVEFGDRFGAVNRPIPGDLLQMVNYLAPAFMSLYLECAMNSVADTPLIEPHPSRAGDPSRPEATKATRRTGPERRHHGGRS